VGLSSRQVGNNRSRMLAHPQFHTAGTTFSNATRHGEQSGFDAKIAARLVAIDKAMDKQMQVKSLYRARKDPAEEHMTKFTLRHWQWWHSLPENASSDRDAPGSDGLTRPAIGPLRRYGRPTDFPLLAMLHALATIWSRVRSSTRSTDSVDVRLTRWRRQPWAMAFQAPPSPLERRGASCGRDVRYG
jgi:hypothetical protein